MRRRPERPLQPELVNSAPVRPDDAEEWMADHLVRLVGRTAHESLDLEDPANAAYLEWAAAEARAQLTPVERLALAEEARAFAARMRAELDQLARDDAAKAVKELEEPSEPSHTNADVSTARGAKPKVARRRRRGPVPMRCVAGGPTEVPMRDASRNATTRDAMAATARTAAAPWIALAVCAGVGRAIWDEPCDRWIAIPPDVPAGEHVALPVRGDSMQPLLHDGDTLLVRVGSACVPGDIVVAREPDDGYVVKRVAASSGARLRLVADNPQYPDVLLPDEPNLVVGTVVLRWCPHDVVASTISPDARATM